MVLRNSVRNIVRTPVKSLLFLLLLTLLTALLGQGLAMLAGSRSMLEAADRTFTTVVQVDGLAQDEQERDLVAELTGHATVLAVDQERSASAWVESIRVPQQETALEHLAILQFTVRHVLDSGAIIGMVQEVYFGPKVRENTYVGLSPADLNGQVLPVSWQKGHRYIAMGYLFPTQTPMKQLTIAPNLSHVPVTPPGGSLEKLQAVLDITDQADVDPVWRELAQVCQVLDGSFPVTLTSAIEIARPFYERETYLTSGRYFLDSEYGAGADVCLISNRLANLLDVQSGDEVFLNLHAGAGSQVTQSYWPDSAETGFLHQAAFRIVGTFKDVESQQYQIYLPQANWAAQKTRLSQSVRFQVENSRVDLFGAAASERLPETCSLTVYDQGYADAVKPVRALEAMALRLAAGTLAAAILTLLLFVHLQISRQRDSARIMARWRPFR